MENGEVFEQKELDRILTEFKNELGLQEIIIQERDFSPEFKPFTGYKYSELVKGNMNTILKLAETYSTYYNHIDLRNYLFHDRKGKCYLTRKPNLQDMNES
jgi:hypothetical protein